MPLAELKAGEDALVRGLHGGHRFVSRLAALGFTPGTRVTVRRNASFGPLIVALRGTQVALGRGEARRVLVHLLEADSELRVRRHHHGRRRHRRW